MTVDKISYSTAIDLHNCGHFFKLKNVDRLPTFDESSATLFGGLIHDHVQRLLADSQTDEHVTQFTAEWKELAAKHSTLIKDEELTAFEAAGTNVLKHLLSAFKENLPYKRVVSIEERLALPAMPEKYSQTFKGFIDIILEMENGKLLIVDLKTCMSAYMFQQFQDKYKDYQLTLYKHFYSIQAKVNLDNIETYFVLLEKNPKSKKPVQFARVTSGAVKIKNCLEFLDKSLSIVNRDKFVKNRLHCRAFGKVCLFYKTKHCT